MNFDTITKTNTVSSVLAAMTAQGVVEYVAFLKSIFANEPAHRLWVIDQQGLILRNAKLPRQFDWMMDIAKFICSNGFFFTSSSSTNNVNDAGAAVSETVAEHCRLRFFGILEDLSRASSSSTPLSAMSSNTATPAVGPSNQGKASAKNITLVFQLSLSL